MNLVQTQSNCNVPVKSNTYIHRNALTPGRKSKLRTTPDIQQPRGNWTHTTEVDRSNHDSSAQESKKKEGCQPDPPDNCHLNVKKMSKA